MTSSDRGFDDLLGPTERNAAHLEMRDNYTPDDPSYLEWREGRRFDAAERWRDWFDLIAATVGRGVQVRRARIVSEPVTDYVRFEYDVSEGLNVAAGELLRWLPRRQAADLLVPGSDLWVFDRSLVSFNHFAGDGSWPADGVEVREDESLANRVAEAFEAVWERAIPHEDYRPA